MARTRRGLKFNAQSPLGQPLRLDNEGGSVDGGEILGKKVLKLTFCEPFALNKVRITSFVKILQGKVVVRQ